LLGYGKMNDVGSAKERERNPGEKRYKCEMYNGEKEVFSASSLIDHALLVILSAQL
jgi:hypothetical protein